MELQADHLVVRLLLVPPLVLPLLLVQPLKHATYDMLLVFVRL